MYMFMYHVLVWIIAQLIRLATICRFGGDWSEGWAHYALRRVVAAAEKELQVNEDEPAFY